MTDPHSSGDDAGARGNDADASSDKDSGSSRIINDPGASMELLNRIAASSMDPGYRQERAKGGRPTSKFMQLWILLLCVVFAFATTWAVRGLRAESDSVPAAMAQLKEQIQDKRDAISELETDSVALTAVLQGHEETIAKTNPTNPALDTVSGVRRVEGPGVTVTITEAVTTGLIPAVDDTIVRSVVNALWAGGGEAMAINGERIGPQTVIRTAGSSILVNLKAVRSPYVIEAIGDQQALLDSARTDKAVQALGNKSGMSIAMTSSNRLILGSVPLSQTWYVAPAEVQLGEDEE